MMRYRLLSAAVLVPVVLIVVYLGGWYFWGLVLLVLTLSGREYALLLRRQASGPSAAFVLALVWVFVLAARFPAWRLREWGLSACVLGSLAWAVVRYERGLAGAVTDWALTVAGGLYLGWTGAHFSYLRDLNAPPALSLFAPAHGGGLAWVILALGIVWLADTGAFLVGRRWGRHKLSPRVSPFKTWEGYGGGVALATAGGVLLPIAMSALSPLLGETSAVTVWDGLALGALISILSPLGDLGESMLKRHAGAKDSSNLIPGHGGMFDRIDSLLWAAVIAFYYASWAAR